MKWDKLDENMKWDKLRNILGYSVFRQGAGWGHYPAPTCLIRCITNQNWLNTLGPHFTTFVPMPDYYDTIEMGNLHPQTEKGKTQSIVTGTDVLAHSFLPKNSSFPGILCMFGIGIEII